MSSSNSDASISDQGEGSDAELKRRMKQQEATTTTTTTTTTTIANDADSDADATASATTSASVSAMRINSDRHDVQQEADEEEEEEEFSSSLFSSPVQRSRPAAGQRRMATSSAPRNASAPTIGPTGTTTRASAPRIMSTSLNAARVQEIENHVDAMLKRTKSPPTSPPFVTKQRISSSTALSPSYSSSSPHKKNERERASSNRSSTALNAAGLLQLEQDVDTLLKLRSSNAPLAPASAPTPVTSSSPSRFATTKEPRSSTTQQLVPDESRQSTSTNTSTLSPILNAKQLRQVETDVDAFLKKSVTAKQQYYSPRNLSKNVITNTMENNTTNNPTTNTTATTASTLPAATYSTTVPSPSGNSASLATTATTTETTTTAHESRIQKEMRKNQQLSLSSYTSPPPTNTAATPAASLDAATTATPADESSRIQKERQKNQQQISSLNSTPEAAAAVAPHSDTKTTQARMQKEREKNHPQASSTSVTTSTSKPNGTAAAKAAEAKGTSSSLPVVVATTTSTTQSRIQKEMRKNEKNERMGDSSESEQKQPSLLLPTLSEKQQQMLQDDEYKRERMMQDTTETEHQDEEQPPPQQPQQQKLPASATLSRKQQQIQDDYDYKRDMMNIENYTERQEDDDFGMGHNNYNDDDEKQELMTKVSPSFSQEEQQQHQQRQRPPPRPGAVRIAGINAVNAEAEEGYHTDDNDKPLWNTTTNTTDSTNGPGASSEFYTTGGSSNKPRSNSNDNESMFMAVAHVVVEEEEQVQKPPQEQLLPKEPMATAEVIQVGRCSKQAIRILVVSLCVIVILVVALSVAMTRNDTGTKIITTTTTTTNTNATTNTTTIQSNPPLCEYSVDNATICNVIQNGVCNHYDFSTPDLNTLEFDYDGGDCCEATCISNRIHSCGKDYTGYIDVGYGSCHLVLSSSSPLDAKNETANHSTTSRSSHWMLKGDPTFIVNNRTLALGKEPPYTVALSNNGRHMAIGDPKSNVVHVLDQDGANWVHRGVSSSISTTTTTTTTSGINNPILAPPGTKFFGTKIQLTNGIENDAIQVNNPLSKVKLQLLVHAIRDDEEGEDESNPDKMMVFLYYCDDDTCTQQAPQQDDDDVDHELVISNSFYTSFPHTAVLSSNGDTMAVLLHERKGYPTPSNRLFVQEMHAPENQIALPLQYRDLVYALSLSGSGSVVAVRFAQRYYKTSDPHPVTLVTRTFRLQDWSGLYNKHVKSGLAGGQYELVPMGQDIIETVTTVYSEINIYKTQAQGNTVSLSLDGTIMALTMPFQKDLNQIGVDVYDYQATSTNTTGNWIKRGDTIPIELPTTGGTAQDISIDLSDDGSTLAVSNGNAVTVYKWNNESQEWVLDWEQSFTKGSLLLDLSADGSSIALGGNAIQGVFKDTADERCPVGFLSYHISLFLDNIDDLTIPGFSDGKEFQLYIFTSDLNGQVTLHALFEYFRSKKDSTIANTFCLPCDKSLLFFFKKTDPEPAFEGEGPPGNYTIFREGEQIATVTPASNMEFYYIKKCDSCDNSCPGVVRSLPEAQLFVESGGEFDWYARTTGDDGVDEKGEIVSETLDPSARTWRYRGGQEWFLLWQFVSINVGDPAELGCIEVAVRKRDKSEERDPLMPVIAYSEVQYEPPTFFWENERIQLAMIQSDEVYGDIYAYNSCVNVSEFDLNYFEDDFGPVVQTTQSPITTQVPPTSELNSLNLVIMSSPCNSLNPNITLTAESDVCGMVLDPQTNYILESDIVCSNLNGTTLSSQTCLDCRGNTLKNNVVGERDADWDLNPFVGINIPSNTTGSAVYNCGVEDFEIGIVVDGKDNRIIHTDIILSKADGLRVNATENSIACSKIKRNNDFGINVGENYNNLDNRIDVSHTVIDENRFGFQYSRHKFLWSQDNRTRMSNIRCAVIRDNFEGGVYTEFNLNVSDTILYRNGDYNLATLIGDLWIDRVSSCGSLAGDIGYYDWADFGNDMIDRSDVTCDVVDKAAAADLSCDAPCTGTCVDSASCPEQTSILPDGCGMCSNPGRFTPI